MGQCHDCTHNTDVLAEEVILLDRTSWVIANTGEPIDPLESYYSHPYIIDGNKQANTVLMDTDLNAPPFSNNPMNLVRGK
jgi:hypothetical protein